MEVRPSRGSARECRGRRERKERWTSHRARFGMESDVGETMGSIFDTNYYWQNVYILCEHEAYLWQVLPQVRWSVHVLVLRCVQIMSELWECPCCSMSEGQRHEGLRSGDIRDALGDAEGPECGPMRCPVQRSRNRLVTAVMQALTFLFFLVFFRSCWLSDHMTLTSAMMTKLTKAVTWLVCTPVYLYTHDSYCCAWHHTYL